MLSPTVGKRDPKEEVASLKRAVATASAFEEYLSHSTIYQPNVHRQDAAALPIYDGLKGRVIQEEQCQRRQSFIARLLRLGICFPKSLRETREKSNAEE